MEELQIPEEDWALEAEDTPLDWAAATNTSAMIAINFLKVFVIELIK